MFGHQFDHGVLRKYVIMFGNMFNDITVSRKNNAGTEVQSIKVPIAYGPKENWLARMNADPQLDREVAIQLPRLGFEITQMSYSPTRTLNKLHKNIAIGATTDKFRSQFTPVPYDIMFSLYGFYKYNEDAVQVTEQILPFFRPEWTHSLKLIPSMGEYYDIPTVLQDMSIEDSYEADFLTRRAIIHTYNFVVKGYLFGPVTNRGIIKRTLIDFTIPQSNTGSTLVASTSVGPQSRLTLTPGVLANGSPTSNSSASVALGSIDANSNYGYAFDNEDFFDGVARHEHDV